jgi:hypothetical protein
MKTCEFCNIKLDLKEQQEQLGFTVIMGNDGRLQVICEPCLSAYEVETTEWLDVDINKFGDQS